MSQLDSAELDEDLLSVLQEQFLGIFKVLPSTWLLQFKPELRAGLKLVLWWYSIGKLGRTFGQDMLDVKYCTGDGAQGPVSAKKLALLFISVGVEWVVGRFHGLASAVLPGLRPTRAERILKWVTATINFLSLLNFVTFLLQGRYATLQDRLLGLQLAPMKPQALRSISYVSMNQEILWHGFSEFLFLVLPHLNLFVIRNWLQRLFISISLTPPSLPTDYSMCVFCELPPTHPRVSSCGHVYCYYCLQASCMAYSKFPCCVCGHLLTTLT